MEKNIENKKEMFVIMKLLCNKKIYIVLLIGFGILFSINIVSKLYKKQNCDEKTKIKYIEYSESNGYTFTGIKYIISQNEKISAEKYILSSETSDYEKIEKQTWTSEKWVQLENELYDIGLEDWSKKQKELDSKYDDFPTDSNSYNLTIIFNDNSELKLNAYAFCVFKIDDIIEKYFQ